MVSKQFSLLFSLTFLCANVAAEFKVSDIRSAFERHGVRTLEKRDLHDDTRNDRLVHLGEKLFFDKILSGNKDISCATCHFPTKGTGDNLPIPIGTGGSGLGEDRELGSGHFIPRNAPAAFNMGYDSFHTTMWDGRISISFELGKIVLDTPEDRINGSFPDETEIANQLTSIAAAQAMFPVTSFHEMRGEEGDNDVADAEDNIEVWKILTARLTQNQHYRKLFREAYPELKSISELNFGHVARAIGAFEMASFRADSSVFDDFLGGSNRALSRAQLRGANIFTTKGKCLSCHNGPHLTDFKFYSSGMPQLGPGKEDIRNNDGIGEDLGLLLITDNDDDLYKFKTPTLRNVYYTGPWSHAGAYNDLKGFLYHHTNPEDGMAEFLAWPNRYIDDFRFATLVDFDFMRNLDRVNSASEVLQSIELTSSELDDLVQLLKSMSDRGLFNDVRIPESVPSGLPVD